MKVFVSWSGAQSRLLASALSKWLPDVLQDVSAWMSEHDIAAGSQWSNNLNAELQSTAFGIICLTPENLTAPWLLFEAGAIFKALETARVIPYHFGVSVANIEFPLAQFQCAGADERGTLRLLQSLNEHRENPMSPDRLERVFEVWWPSLEERIAAIPSKFEAEQPLRNDRQLLEEILELVRRGKGSPAGSVAREDVWKTLADVNRSDLTRMTDEEIRKFREKLRGRLIYATGSTEYHIEQQLDVVAEVERGRAEGDPREAEGDEKSG